MPSDPEPVETEGFVANGSGFEDLQEQDEAATQMDNPSGIVEIASNEATDTLVTNAARITNLDGQPAIASITTRVHFLAFTQADHFTVHVKEDGQICIQMQPVLFGPDDPTVTLDSSALLDCSDFGVPEALDPDGVTCIDTPAFVPVGACTITATLSLGSSAAGLTHYALQNIKLVQHDGDGDGVAGSQFEGYDTDEYWEAWLDEFVLAQAELSFGVRQDPLSEALSTAIQWDAFPAPVLVNTSETDILEDQDEFTPLTATSSNAQCGQPGEPCGYTYRVGLRSLESPGLSVLLGVDTPGLFPTVFQLGRDHEILEEAALDADLDGDIDLAELGFGGDATVFSEDAVDAISDRIFGDPDELADCGGAIVYTGLSFDDRDDPINVTTNPFNVQIFDLGAYFPELPAEITDGATVIVPLAASGFGDCDPATQTAHAVEVVLFGTVEKYRVTLVTRPGSLTVAGANVDRHCSISDDCAGSRLCVDNACQETLSCNIPPDCPPGHVCGTQFKFPAPVRACAEVTDPLTACVGQEGCGDEVCLAQTGIPTGVCTGDPPIGCLFPFQVCPGVGPAVHVCQFLARGPTCVPIPNVPCVDDAGCTEIIGPGHGCETDFSTGVCTAPVEPCTDDSDCGDDWCDPGTGTCQPGVECDVDTPCSEGFCSPEADGTESLCVTESPEPCSVGDPNACSGGFYYECLAETSTCGRPLTGCRDTSECDAGEVCDPADGRCESLADIGCDPLAPDCEDGFVCRPVELPDETRTHVCVQPADPLEPCHDDRDCQGACAFGSDEVGICATDVCATDAECQPWENCRFLTEIEPGVYVGGCVPDYMRAETCVITHGEACTLGPYCLGSVDEAGVCADDLGE